ncbi:MAG: tripartite tricarboxylate transporter TctB family protein [Spirochaetales bacterium]|nr:tripartite tricarboxylate transporter TctB family protein [Spirochaetales bacterium]
MKKISLVISVIMIAISLLIIVTAMSYPKSNAGVPGPGFFPTVLSVIVICLSFALIITQRKAEDVPVVLFSREQLPVYLSMGLVFVYLIMLNIVGFMISTPLFLIAVMKLFKVRKLWVILAVAFCTTVATYIVFTKVLSVILPSGMFF